MLTKETILIYAIPFFFLLIAIEAIVAGKEYRQQKLKRDFFTSFIIGAGFLIASAFAKSTMVLCFVFLNRYGLFNLPANKWWVWLLCFICDDFTYYWFHRISHRVRFLWASHVVHHSSEIYSYSSALRQGWTGSVTGAFLFWAWMPLLGFNAVMVIFIKSLSIIYQYWTHTELVKKMPPWFEFVFNTPSHHRVHHGSDKKYIDKNYGGIFIIWDRLFRSFIAEDEQPHYGIARKTPSQNILQIVFFEWNNIVNQLIKENRIKQFLRIIFKLPA